MKSLDFLSSLKFGLLVLLIFILYQAKATFYPTELDARLSIYSSWWFAFIIFVLSLNLLGALFKYKIYKKIPIFMIHVSVLVVVLGAAVTKFFGFEGVLHLRDGQESSTILVRQIENGKVKVYRYDLGFRVRLIKFKVKMYPGSRQPSSFDSYVSIKDGKRSFDYNIYMNHILKYKGFRFYQMSYDKDFKGTLLSVSYDPGVDIVYFGYFLLIVGLVLSLIYKKGSFYKYISNFGKLSFLIMMFISSTCFSSKAMSFANWTNNSRIVSKIWSEVLVQSMGRVEPMDTLDLDVLHKIAKTDSINGLNYNQVILGMVLFPKHFQSIPMIYVGDKKIISLLGIESKGKRLSYDDFFDEKGRYKLKEIVLRALSTPPPLRSALDRDLINLNERVVVANSVYTLSIFKLFPPLNPKSVNYTWYSPQELKKVNPVLAMVYLKIFGKFLDAASACNTKMARIEAKKIYNLQRKLSGSIIPSKLKVELEILYNHIDIFTKLIFIYLILGILAIFIGFYEIFKSKRFIKVDTTFVVLSASALVFHTANMVIRWYISNHAPWSNAYESIVFISWTTIFASIAFFRKHVLALGSGLFVGGVFLFVAFLYNLNPQITNLVPVLKSYWLLFHVSVITASYGFFSVSFMLGFANLILFAFRRRFELDMQIKKISWILYLANYIGLILLVMGTIFGSIWANESWGRYWSWDPKETWSLISILVYVIVLHLRYVFPKIESYTISLGSFISYYAILMTYFGVNFYISQGLHSYGQIKGAFSGMIGLFAVLDGLLSFDFKKIWWSIINIPIPLWIFLSLATLVIILSFKNRYFSAND